MENLPKIKLNLALNLPKIGNEERLGMYLLQFSSRNSKSKVPYSMSKAYSNEVVDRYWAVFNNNNDHRLKALFSDPFL